MFCTGLLALDQILWKCKIWYQIATTTTAAAITNTTTTTTTTTNNNNNNIEKFVYSTFK
jgi:hypothetical protein